MKPDELIAKVHENVGLPVGEETRLQYTNRKIQEAARLAYLDAAEMAVTTGPSVLARCLKDKAAEYGEQQ